MVAGVANSDCGSESGGSKMTEILLALLVLVQTATGLVLMDIGRTLRALAIVFEEEEELE